MDTRALREWWRLQAGSSATLAVRDQAGDADLSGWDLEVTPSGGDVFTVSASDDDGARVFTLSGEQTELVEAAGGGRGVIVADGDELVVFPLTADRSGTAEQDRELTVVLGQAEVTVVLSVAVGGGGGGGDVASVNGKTGVVVLDHTDVGADAAGAAQVVADLVGPRNAPNGFGGLDGSGTFPDILMPASIARDTEIGAAVSAHSGATDPHGDRAYTDDQLAPVDVRAGLFTADVGIDFPVSAMGGTIDDGVLTLPNFPAVGARILLSGEDSAAENGIYVGESYEGDVLTAVRRPESMQPWKIEHLGRQVTVSFNVSDSRFVIYAVRIPADNSGSDDEVFLFDTSTYEPIDEEDWPEDPIPGRIPLAIDALAAREIPELPIAQSDVTDLTNDLAAKVTKPIRQFRLSDYADPTGVLSAREGMQDALTALKNAGGGELVVDGTFLIDGHGCDADFAGAAHTVRVVGEGAGTLILCQSGVTDATMLNLGRANSLVFDGVLFYGSNGTDLTGASTVPDFKKGIYVWDCSNLVFQSCVFVSLVAETVSDTDKWDQGAVVQFERTAASFRDCEFQGCGGSRAGMYEATVDTPVIRGAEFHSLVFDNTIISDVVNGGYLGAAHPFRRQPSAHVLIQDPRGWSETGGMKSQFERGARFVNCHFDEATCAAIVVENAFSTDRLRNLVIDTCSIASPSTAASPFARPGAVYVTETERVSMLGTNLGHFGTTTVGARFEDVRRIDLDGITARAPITTIEADAECGTLTYRNLKDLEVSSAAAVTVNLDAQGAKADTAVQPGDLAAVASSGSYLDLGDKPTIPLPGVWQLVEERVLGSDGNNLDFTDLDQFAEIEIRYSARCVGTASTQYPILARFNGDSGANYNFGQSGRIVNTNLLSNTTGETAGYLGYAAGSQTNADRWATGTITIRCDQPAGSRKYATGTCVFGRSTGAEIGQADVGLEWTNTADAIETLRLYAASNFVAGSRFTVLARTP